VTARPTREAAALPEPRSVCGKCRRPSSECFCKDLQPIATATRVLILQHPRERDVPIGTARLARIGLQNSLLRIDVDFSEDRVVRECLAGGNAYLLFPGDDAIDVETTNFPSPVTLVVLDGTWSQASKLLKSNPMLAALPRLRLTPSQPSLYGEVRREPAEHCVATIEAIAHVLGQLENDPERFTQLLRPFANMVERQLYFAKTVKSNRHRRDKPMRAPRDRIPAPLRRQYSDLVCVHGEANAWPHLHPDRTPPETVHWLAKRLATGETFEAVIAPRGRLAPSTCRHIQLGTDALAAGEAWDSFAERFMAFLRPTDLLVAWGHFPLGTLVADGFRLEHRNLDVRPVVGNVLRQRTGTVEESVVNLGVDIPTVWGLGRGGERLASLCGVVEKLRAWPLPAAAKAE